MVAAPLALSRRATLRLVAVVDRTFVRARRSALARSLQRDAAAAVAAHAATIPELASANHLAAYVAHHGEVDPARIVHAAWCRDVLVSLPVVHDPARPDALAFATFTSDTTLVRGPYGISVPPPDAPRCAIDDLDIVLVPVVAFDDQLNRLGSGAGYYDRTFAKRLRSPAPPMLIGLAYHWQQAARLAPAVWDVPLDVVVTDHGVLRAARH